MNDTIVAIATPTGRGGIGIVRVSGPQSATIVAKMIKKIPRNRYAEYTKIYDSEDNVIDESIVIFFKNPHSFTGEDVVEFQCHGGPFLLDSIVQEVLKFESTRLAKPGEFTERAFLNGKIDLTQAEAIADIINANSITASQNAVKSLQGDFSILINNLGNEIIKLRTYVEATIDFPDESIDFISDGRVVEGINNLLSITQNILQSSKQGVLLKEGLDVVIAGKPNSGKSSLLNALCNDDTRAIVTDVEGTTRDVIRENINLDGLLINIIDTAGLREITEDIVEQIGINKAWNVINESNMILFVYDISRIDNKDQISLFNEIRNKTNNKIPFTIIINKIDKTSNFSIPEIFNNYPTIQLSAKTKEGVNKLIEHLKQIVGYQENNTESVFSARRRHVKALENIENCLQIAKQHIEISKSFELAAEELLTSQNEINKILGNFTPDDLLTEIFSTFCVGK